MNTPAIAQELTTEYPSLSDRIQSSFIDLLFIILLMFGAAEILDRYEDAPDWIRGALFFGMWGVYEPFCITLGCTIGNYIKGIRVRRSGNVEKKINIVQAVIRYILKFSLGWISFLTMHSNAQRRAIHDFAAGSMMIKAK